MKTLATDYSINKPPCECGHSWRAHLCDFEMCIRMGDHEDVCSECDCIDYNATEDVTL